MNLIIISLRKYKMLFVKLLLLRVTSHIPLHLVAAGNKLSISLFSPFGERMNRRTHDDKLRVLLFARYYYSTHEQPSSSRARILPQ